MKLSKFQMAAVKRTAQNIKKLVSTRERLQQQINEIAGKLVEVNNQIEVWETPIKVMTGGYTSEQVIACNGELPEVSEVESQEDLPMQEESSNCVEVDPINV